MQRATTAGNVSVLDYDLLIGTACYRCIIDGQRIEQGELRVCMFLEGEEEGSDKYTKTYRPLNAALFVQQLYAVPGVEHDVAGLRGMSDLNLADRSRIHKATTMA